jgi:uncharacterized membrane protein YfcA
VTGPAELLALLGVGILAGIVATVASLASVVSYPALLALGLPPVSANVTNTVALMFTGFGAAAGSRLELAGQGRRVRRLGVVTGAGGAAGAALLLLTPSQSFEYAAPLLIAAGSIIMLRRPARMRTGDGAGIDGAGIDRAGIDRAGIDRAGIDAAGIDAAGIDAAGIEGAPAGAASQGVSDGVSPGRLEGDTDRVSADGLEDVTEGASTGDPEVADHAAAARAADGGPAAVTSAERGWALLSLFGVSVYSGYFGAASGILMLAVLTRMLAQSLARTNALKNVIASLANGAAGIGFAIFGPVRWTAVVPLAAGFAIGGWIGPSLVRRLPAKGLRVFIGVCGLLLAVRLSISAYA